MALLTVRSVDESGINDVLAALAAAAAGGDSVNQASDLLVVLNNADGSPHTLTVAAPVATAECPGFGALAVAALTLVVAAGDYGFITIPAKYAVSGVFSWTYDAETGLSIGVISLKN